MRGLLDFITGGKGEPTADSFRRLMHGMGILLSIVGLVGLGVHVLFRSLFEGLVSTAYDYFLFNKEPATCVVVGVFFLTAARLMTVAGPAKSGWKTGTSPRGWTIAVVLASLGAAGWGFQGVMHGYPLSMDEYLAQFQARVFASGSVWAVLDEPVRLAGAAAQPIFINVVDHGQAWVSSYLPVHAALLALFEMAHLPGWGGAACNAGALLCLAWLSRNLWPERPWLAVVLTGLLALSPQFLLAGMTYYSMPAHLLFSLLWLVAYRKGPGRGWLLLPWIGVLSMGLHQPILHAVFAAPFLLRFVWGKKWGWLAYLTGSYLAGLAAWIGWWHLTRPLFANEAASYFKLNLFGVLLELSNMLMFMAWQVPLMMALGLWAVWHARRLDVFGRDLALSVVCSMGWMLFWPYTQGHGWGVRYWHAILGNWALLAGYGLVFLRATMSREQCGRLLVFSGAVTLLLLLPWRLWQAYDFSGPYAEMDSRMKKIKTDYVLVNGPDCWYAVDFVRNGPRFDRPIRLHAYLWPELRERGVIGPSATVYRVTPEELHEAGCLSPGSAAKIPLP